MLALKYSCLVRGGKVKNIEDMTGFLLAAYPGQVANVMINSTGSRRRIDEAAPHRM